MSVAYQKRMELSLLNVHPLFIDYDFLQSRPRGGSACIDFFSFGKLCALIDSLSYAGTVYVQKADILPHSGFFLLDLAQVAADPYVLQKIAEDLHLDRIYLEDSRRFPLAHIAEGLKDIQVTMVSFAA